MRLAMTRRQLGVLFGLLTSAAAFVVINCGDASTPPEKSNGITKVTVTPAATGLDTPLDATPDPMGNDIYFIAKDTSGPAVFRVSADGGKPAMLYAGAPLVEPRGISTSADGKTLYIADPAAGTDGKGVIFTMPAAGDTPAPLAGTSGTRPTAIDVHDDLYFTGESNGEPAVFQLPTSATTPTTLTVGAPLAKPDGLAISTDGTVYVSDGQAGMSLAGQVFRIVGGKAVTVGPEFKPGSPAGLAVTLDDQKLLVSSLDPKAGTSQVVILQTKDGSSSVYNDVIKANSVSGGVHRARFKETYAWAGYTQVYTIRLKTIKLDGSTPGGPAN